MNEEQVCQRAAALGLDEITFTNHVMLRFPDYLITPQQLSEHWAAIQVCQARYPELTVRLGLEVDYYQDRVEEVAATIGQYEDIVGRPFDYILGSVHYLHGVRFASSQNAPALFAGQSPASIFRDYFKLMSEAVRSGPFDVMAHPDLIKKYTGELHPPVPFADYRVAVEPFIASLLDTGVGLEINPKGLRHSVAEIYPSDALLALYAAEARKRGVEPVLTLGSDAHRVEYIGFGLAQGIQALRRAGLTALSLFEQRQRRTIPLSSPEESDVK